jgi:hypothetical protein
MIDHHIAGEDIAVEKVIRSDELPTAVHIHAIASVDITALQLSQTYLPQLRLLYPVLRVDVPTRTVVVPVAERERRLAQLRDGLLLRVMSLRSCDRQ